MSQVTVIKSSIDKREYKTFTLANGIETLLVSDPESEKSAAALAVQVGSTSDPRDSQGLAHFLEHMLFLGTKKYPSQKEYMEYIGQNSGLKNAYTDQEKTVYMFDISNTAFEGALDRLSQFFISPLLTPELAGQEMNAVDSEYKLYLMNDIWRKWQLTKTLCKKENPFSLFNVGNLETLKHPNVYNHLIEFHKNYYSANAMKLILLGAQPLPELEKLAETYFSPIENKNAQIEYCTEYPFEQSMLGRGFKVIPVADKDTMDIILTFESMLPNYRQNPLHVIASLLGHEGENALLPFLIEEGLALELMVVKEFPNMKNSFDWLWVTITLTKEDLFFDESTKNLLKNPTLEPKITKKHLGLPPPNKFIPNDLSLLPKDPTLEGKVVYPTKVLDSGHHVVFYKPDFKFEMPKAFVTAKIVTPFVLPDASLNTICARIYVEIFKNHIRELSYTANQASLKTEFTSTNQSLTVEVNGFNDSMRNYVPELFRQLITFNVETYELMFNNTVQKHIKDNKEFLTSPPFRRAFKEYKEVLATGGLLAEDAIALLEKLNFETFKKFARSWLKRHHIQWLFNGNLKREDAEYISKEVAAIFPNDGAPVKPSDIDFPRVAILPSRNTIFHRFTQNTETYQESNSCLTSFYEVSQNLRDWVLCRLAVNVYDDPFFDTLRTTESLGYAVFAYPMDFDRVSYFGLTVQSNHKSPVFINERVNAFFNKHWEEKVNKMTDDEFDKFVNSVFVNISKKDLSLEEENKRYWEEIDSGRQMFEIKEKRVEELKTIQKADLLPFIQKILYKERRVLELSSICEAHKDENKKLLDERLAKDGASTVAFSTVKDFHAGFEHYQVAHNW